MKDKINLLEEKVRKLEDVKRKKYLTFISAFALIVYIIITVGIFFYWKNLTSENEKITSQIKSKEKIIEKQRKTEEAYLSYRNRILAINNLISQRSQPEVFLDSINSTLPENVIIQSLAFNTEKKIINISLLANNADTTSEFIKIAKDKSKIGSYLEKIEINNLARDKTPVYSFQLSAKVSKNEKED